MGIGTLWDELRWHWLAMEIPEEQNMSFQMYFKCLAIAGLKWGEKQPWDFSLEMNEALGHWKRIVNGFIYRVCMPDLVQKQAARFTVSCSGRKVILNVYVCVWACIRWFIISFHLEKAQCGRVALLQGCSGYCIAHQDLTCYCCRCCWWSITSIRDTVASTWPITFHNNAMKAYPHS